MNMNIKIGIVVLAAFSLTTRSMYMVPESFDSYEKIGNSLQAPLPKTEEEAERQLAVALLFQEEDLIPLMEDVSVSQSPVDLNEANDSLADQANLLSKDSDVVLDYMNNSSHKLIDTSLQASVSTDKEDTELQLALALSLKEFTKEVARIDDEKNEAELKKALLINKPLFDLIKKKGYEDQAINLLDKGLDIAAVQDGCSVLECAAKASATNVVRACMGYAEYPCPTKGEYRNSHERLKAFFMVANRYKVHRDAKRCIIFSDTSLIRDYIKVQFYHLCHGKALSEFAKWAVVEWVPCYAVEHVRSLLKDAHESACTNEIKVMLNSFDEKFADDVWWNMDFKMRRLAYA